MQRNKSRLMPAYLVISQSSGFVRGGRSPLDPRDSTHRGHSRPICSRRCVVRGRVYRRSSKTISVFLFPPFPSLGTHCCGGHSPSPYPPPLVLGWSELAGWLELLCRARAERPSSYQFQSSRFYVWNSARFMWPLFHN